MYQENNTTPSHAIGKRTEHADYLSSFSSYLTRVFALMFLGLGVTSAVAVFASHNLTLMRFSLTTLNGQGGLVFFLVYLVIAFGFGRAVSKLSTGVAMALFMLYSVMTGLMFSMLALVYQTQSIWMSFLAAGVFFALLAVYGAITKRDLTSMGRVLGIALLAMIIMSVVNMFMQNSGASTLLAIAGIVIFAGYTVYDINKLKQTYVNLSDERTLAAMAVAGAFMLYLDFINLFLRILQLFGRRRD